MKTARTIILATLTACRLFAGETAKVAANATADFGDYTYDGAGNITGAGADRFTYDQYGRIKAAALTQGSTTITQSFGYDRYGNLLSIATTGDPTLVPAVDPLTNRINKLTATTNAFGSYDANGNLTSYNSSSSFAYDPLDVMTESTVGGQRRVYLYTAGNERIAVLKVTATGAVTGSTWTLRDASAKVLRKLSKDGAGTWRWDEDYIYRGAQLLAAEVPGNTLQFHLDHLGTPRVITGNGGARLSSHTYFPFGREVAAFSTPDAEVMKFTGHERDDVNLDYMHARYYLPFGGRFLSVDPGKDWDDTKPQSWNLYTYARNNPVGNTDPNGKETRVFIAGQASIFSNYKGSFGHAALLVTDGDRRQGISEGGDAHPVKNGELGFAKTYLAQDRDVFVFVIKTTAEQDRAMINYLDKTNPGEIRTSGQVDTFPAGSNNNCTTAVVNVLKAGGVIPKSADPNGANSGYHLPGELRKALEPAGDLDGNVKERTKVQAEADRKPAS